MEYSLIEKFGELPVKPEVFATLDPKLKWMGKAVEGDNWCTNCGTLSPQVPRKHHQECFSYMDANEFPEYENPLGNCPECSSDSLGIDSSREMRWSVISCGDCGYSFGGKLDEETLTEKFKKQPQRIDGNT